MKKFLTTLSSVLFFSTLFAQEANAIGPCDISKVADQLPQLKIVTKGETVDLVLLKPQPNQPLVMKIYTSLRFINEGFLAAGRMSLNAQRDLALALDLKAEADIINQTIQNLNGDESIEEKNASMIKIQKDIDLEKKSKTAIKSLKAFDEEKKKVLTQAYISSISSKAAMGAIAGAVVNLGLSTACIIDKIIKNDASLISDIQKNAAVISPEVIKSWPGQFKNIIANASAFGKINGQNSKMFKKVSKKAKVKLPKFTPPKPKVVESEL